MQHFILKLGVLFPFAKRDENVSKIKSTQAGDMAVLRRYSNVESVIIFVLAIALLKDQI